MTAEIDMKSAESASVKARCHMMPFVIHHNGETAVDRYFEPTIRKDGDSGHFRTSFRGRSLKGKEMALPVDYVGLTVVNDDSPERDLTTSWKIANSFHKITYWNWDTVPSANDKLQQAFSWLDVAHAIHGKPTAE